MNKLILASGSPRRKQLLTDLGIRFEVLTPNIPEIKRPGETARGYVTRLSKSKAKAVFKSGKSWCVLSADTIVVLGKEILEKPKSKVDAIKMLKKLSGKSHEVLTGFCLLTDDKMISQVVRTKIRFAAMPDKFWKWYVSTGEPLDKAGAYAAQGGGMSFIKEVKGSYSNVVGLPLAEVLFAFQKNFKKKLYELR